MGKGRIIGADSGDIRSHESFQASARNAYQGRCLVIIQSARQAGKIQLKATSTGLIEGQIAVTLSPAKRRGND
jgi:beta-galactosidase